MRIKREPKAFFMYSVFLAFNPVQPDQEDDAIRAYLDEHELIPWARQTANGGLPAVMSLGLSRCRAESRIPDTQ